jgi:hypothetical protein
VAAAQQFDDRMPAIDFTQGFGLMKRLFIARERVIGIGVGVLAGLILISFLGKK